MSTAAPPQTPTRPRPSRPPGPSEAITGSWYADLGLGGAVAFGVFGYVLAIAELRFLPETHGKELVPVG
jgi:hypothetical protein